MEETNGRPVVQSKSAICLCGPWISAAVKEVFPDQGDGVAAFYKMEGKGGAYSVTSSDWQGIHSASQNKELAWRSIQALTSEEPFSVCI